MRRRFPPPSFRRRSVVGFTVDETGNVTQWRFLDNTCEGKDSVGVEPATPRKVRGVPQRTAYEYGVNFLGMVE